MDAVRNGMEFNGRVWKEPRGFIKILELIFGICAFATTSSYGSLLSFTASCTKENHTDIPNHVITLDISYPFDLEDIRVQRDPCVKTGISDPLGGSYSSSAEFFVAIGVLTFLYCLGALLLYIFLEKLYRSVDIVSKADFIISLSFAFLWLVASSAWARGLTGLKGATDPDYVVNRMIKLGCSSCQSLAYPSYANLNISVILGFLNFFIWSGNVWFLYKETSWFKGKQPVVMGPGSSGPGGGPMGPGMMQPNQF